MIIKNPIVTNLRTGYKMEKLRGFRLAAKNSDAQWEESNVPLKIKLDNKRDALTMQVCFCCIAINKPSW